MISLEPSNYVLVRFTTFVLQILLQNPYSYITLYSLLWFPGWSWPNAHNKTNVWFRGTGSGGIPQLSSSTSSTHGPVIFEEPVISVI